MTDTLLLEALDQARMIGDEEDRTTASLALSLRSARRQNEPDPCSLLVSLLSTLDRRARAETLCTLISRLPSSFLRESINKPWMMLDIEARVEALVAILPRVEPVDRIPILHAAVASASVLPDELMRAEGADCPPAPLGAT